MKITHNAAFSNAVEYGFFGRAGGVSDGVYKSLNGRSGTGDDPDAVYENRSRVAAELGVPVDKLISLSQCHSADCLIINGSETGEIPVQADAMVTDLKGIGLGILTADCGPVLFEGAKEDGRPVIGAAHAGWGGAVKGVLESTVDQMIQLGALRETIRAAIGPCIGQASYEVSAGFEKPFIDHDPESEKFFKAGKKDGFMMFDLAGYIAFRLANAGIQKVKISGIDTYKDEENCFSFRRATHRGESDYGRQISAIVIKA